jgi:hypothetical protein
MVAMVLAGLAVTSGTAALLEARAIALTAHAHSPASPSTTRLADR